MKFVRLFTGEDQQSHFKEESMPLTLTEHGSLAEPITTQQVIYGEAGDECKELDWHNAPCRQFIVMLDGAIEVEIGDGTKMTFEKGDLLLAEDLTGQGHITRAATNATRRYLAIPIQENLS